MLQWSSSTQCSHSTNTDEKYSQAEWSHLLISSHTFNFSYVPSAFLKFLEACTLSFIYNSYKWCFTLISGIFIYFWVKTSKLSLFSGLIIKKIHNIDTLISLWSVLNNIQYLTIFCCQKHDDEQLSRSLARAQPCLHGIECLQTVGTVKKLSLQIKKETKHCSTRNHEALVAGDSSRAFLPYADKPKVTSVQLKLSLDLGNLSAFSSPLCIPWANMSPALSTAWVARNWGKFWHDMTCHIRATRTETEPWWPTT